jgi:hypothetical protein
MDVVSLVFAHDATKVFYKMVKEIGSKLTFHSIGARR